MTSIDLKSQIHNLLGLQTVDSEIYGLKAEKEAKPGQIEEIEASFEAKKLNLASLQAKATDLLKQRKDKELELASKEEAAKKLQGQLYSLKTNKEYQAMLQQIQDAKTDASVVEDKILELFDNTDRLKGEISKEEERLKEEEKLFLEQKKKIEERVKEIDQRLAQLEARRSQAVSSIDPKILARYDRILASRDGLAIVIVKKDSCGGCNMLVPPQVINLIKMYERVITCEVCNRMLCIGDE